MKIQQKTYPSFDGYRISNHPLNKVPNGRKYYRHVLYSTLQQLHPRQCLEIGTHYFGTTEVFQRYFDEFCPEGKVITVDVKKWVEPPQAHNVVSLIVKPHLPFSSLRERHPIKEEEIDCDYNDSVEKNCKIIQQVMSKSFDFCFIDGDHHRESLLKDIEICTRLSKSPHYMLLDDVHDFAHDSAHLFRSILSQQYYTYEFEDWHLVDGVPGAALMWSKTQQ